MCDDRERLIGYVYDECDAGERRVIDAHLHECGECRAEVQALRGVRADLLAWEVRGEPDVWRPREVTPARAAWWQQVPAWAMAAAAALVMLAGISGGVAARALAPAPAAPAPIVQQLPPAAPAPAAAVTPTDLATLEQRVMDLMRLELARRNQPAPQVVRTADAELNEDMMDAVFKLYDDLVGYRAQTDSKIKVLQAAVEQLAANAGAPAPGR